MKLRLALCCLAALFHSLVASAGSLEEQLTIYAAAAKAANPAFAGFSAARGEKLHTTRFALVVSHHESN